MESYETDENIKEEEEIIEQVESLPQSEFEELQVLRLLRDIECFTVINRGQVWYATLTDQQRIELQEWYEKWLNVTETKIIPQKPDWLI